MADGTIKIDVLLNKQQAKSDAEVINSIFSNLGKGAGDSLKNDLKSNLDQAKAKAKETGESIKKDLTVKGKTEIDTKGAESDLNKVKEKIKEVPDNHKTKIKVDGDNAKQEAENIKKRLKAIPDKVKTQLVADAKEAGIANFERALKKLPPKKQVEILSKVQKGEVIDYEELLRKLPVKVVTQLKLNDQATPGMRAIQAEAKNTGKRFGSLREIIMGTFAGGLIQAGVQNLISGLRSAAQAGMEYNKQQDTMRTVWKALTTEAPQDGQRLVGFINSLSQHSIYASETVDRMAQSFYHVHSNVGETERWTKAFVNLGSTLHMSNDALAEAGEQFAKIVAGGKASAEDMNVMINRFPMFGEALQQATGKSMKQLYDLSARGKLTANDFVGALEFLGKKYKSGTQEAMTSTMGMGMYLKSRWSVLTGEVMKSSFDMSKSTMASIKNLLSDGMLKEYASMASKFISGMITWISKLLTYIDEHKHTILDIIKNLGEIVGIIGKAVWDTFIGVVKAIGTALGIVSEKAVKTNDPLKILDSVLKAIVDNKEKLSAFIKVLTGMFMVKKILDMTKALKEYISLIKELAAIKIKDNFLGGSVPAETPNGRVPTNVPAGSAPATGTSRLAEIMSSAPMMVGATGAMSEMFSANSRGQKIGGMIGAVGGSFGGATLGATIGTAVGGPVGTILGGTLGQLASSALGSTVGKKLGEKIGGGIEDILKGKTYGVTAKVHAKVSTKELDASNISKKVKKQIDELNKTALVKLGVDPKSSADAEKKASKTFKSINKTINDYYTNKEKRAKKDLQQLVANGQLTQKEADKRFARLQKQDKKEAKERKASYSQITKDLSKYNKDVNKIWNDQTKSEKQRKKELQKLNKKFTKTYVNDVFNANKQITKDIRQGAKQQQSIYKNLVKKKGKLSKQDLKRIMKDANQAYKMETKSARKTRDGVISDAKKKYRGTVKNARRQYEENGTISRKEYNDIVRNAENARDDAIGAARRKYNKVTAKARDEHKKVSSEASQQASDVSWSANKGADDTLSAYSRQSSGVSKILSSIASWIQGFVKPFGGKAPNNPKYNPPHVRYSGKATGGAIAQSGYALVGEAGPELRYKPYSGSVDLIGLNGPEFVEVAQGEQILNANDTSKVMSGTYGRALPGYAGGTTTLERWLGGIGDLASKAADKAMDLVSSMIEKVKHPVKTMEEIAAKAFNIHSIPLVGTVTQDWSGNVVHNAITMFEGVFKKLKDKLDDAGSKGPISKSLIRRAARKMKVDPPDSFINNLMKVIMSESGGRNIVQQIHDVNSGGNEARGILQYTPGTFRAYAMPGHTNIMSPYDQLLAFFNNSDWRNSIGMTTIWGHTKMDWLHSGPQGSRRFANGGWAYQPSIFGEVNGEPEVAINPARSTADSLILQAIKARANKDPQSFSAKIDSIISAGKSLNATTAPVATAPTSSNSGSPILNEHDYSSRLEKIGAKLDALIEKRVVVDGHSFANTYERYGIQQRRKISNYSERGLAMNVKF